MLLLSPPPAPLSSTDDVDQLEQTVARSQQRLLRHCAEYVLGTRLELLIYSGSTAMAQLIAHTVRAEITRLNRVLNHRRDDSELSQLHRSRCASVSEDLFCVLQLSEAWRRISGGAFDGRMGALSQLWATAAEPQPSEIERALTALRESTVTLDPVERWVELSSAVTLSLDAIAKGYIVDAALKAARLAAPTVEGLALSIGGDIRCFGRSPVASGWRIGITDPTIPAENAALVDAVALGSTAIATSGRGPRDCIGNGYRSMTISPFTGRPVGQVISATVVASHAADADAIATACMVLPPAESVAWVERLDGVAARITETGGQVYRSAQWPTRQRVAAATPTAAVATDAKPSLPPELRWPADWELGITYTEPDVKVKDDDFRQPYIALWVTDAQDKIVSTIFMLGRDAKYHHDNFIWWGSYNERAEHEVELRSRGTTLSGHYLMYWAGFDDEWNKVPIGRYVLHLETSQEHGKHSYRTIPIDIGRERFKLSLPNQAESGGLEITYGHYNDRFNQPTESP